MTWFKISEKGNWEYSNTPEVDDPYNFIGGSYVVNHVNGIRTNSHGDMIYVYCRQITGLSSGTGELSKAYYDKFLAFPPCPELTVSWHTGELLDSTHRKDNLGGIYDILITPNIDPITETWDGADATYSFAVIGTPAPAAIVTMDAVQQVYTDGAGNAIGFTEADLELLDNDQYFFGSVSPNNKELINYQEVLTGNCLFYALERVGKAEAITVNGDIVTVGGEITYIRI